MNVRNNADHTHKGLFSLTPEIVPEKCITGISDAVEYSRLLPALTAKTVGIQTRSYCFCKLVGIGLFKLYSDWKHQGMIIKKTDIIILVLLP